ncbi:hypothetical protein T492DRAFT_1052144, partial [Pavlovales sp. CCMP2436]
AHRLEGAQLIRVLRGPLLGAFARAPKHLPRIPLDEALQVGELGSAALLGVNAAHSGAPRAECVRLFGRAGSVPPRPGPRAVL